MHWVNGHLLDKPLRQLRRILILLVGGTVLTVGVAMIVLPGPAILVIPAGLGILAVEFAWARRLLKKGKQMAHSGMDALTRRHGSDPTPRKTGDSHSHSGAAHGDPVTPGVARGLQTGGNAQIPPCAPNDKPSFAG